MGTTMWALRQTRYDDLLVFVNASLITSLSSEQAAYDCISHERATTKQIVS